MRILIVEDEHKIANALKKGLSQLTYVVDVAYDGDHGVELATTETYDLAILDRMLPGSTDGIGIVRAMREKNIHTPVLLLTAKDRVLDRVDGLNAGADDYLVKPFAFVELAARVRALLRRPTTALDSIIKYGDLSINTENFDVVRSDKPIRLSSKEYRLLEYMARNPGRVLTKDMIMQHVWNYDAEILPNTVEVYVGYLRNKIDKPFKGVESLIHTRRGFGYVFGDAPPV